MTSIPKNAANEILICGVVLPCSTMESSPLRHFQRHTSRIILASSLAHTSKREINTFEPSFFMRIYRERTVLFESSISSSSSSPPSAPSSPSSTSSSSSFSVRRIRPLHRLRPLRPFRPLRLLCFLRPLRLLISSPSPSSSRAPEVVRGPGEPPYTFANSSFF